MYHFEALFNCAVSFSLHIFFQNHSGCVIFPGRNLTGSRNFSIIGQLFLDKKAPISSCFILQITSCMIFQED